MKKLRLPRGYRLFHSFALACVARVSPESSEEPTNATGGLSATGNQSATGGATSGVTITGAPATGGSAHTGGTSGAGAPTTNGGPGSGGSPAPACTGAFRLGAAVITATHNDSTRQSGMVAGDFNNDGWPDLAVSDRQNSVGGITLGAHHGRFGASNDYPTGNDPRGLATADLNGDGNLDLVTPKYSGGVSVLLGNCDGTFEPNIDFGIERPCLHVAIGDLNGDSIPDFVTDWNAEQDVQVFIGRGDGAFDAPVHYVVTDGITSITLTDIDSDGQLDVIATAVGTAAIEHGNGDGTLVPTLGFPTPANGIPLTSGAAGDLNRDNHADLVTTSQNGALFVYQRNGSTYGGYLEAFWKVEPPTMCSLHLLT